MQTKSSHITTFLAAAGLAASLAASGCGNDSQADLVHGKQLFVERCGACHTLARAENAQGVVGPNLDKAFGSARADGMTSATIQGVVIGQIKHPSQRVPGPVRMPAGLVTGMDARDVAAYVGYAAGAKGKDEGALAEAGKPEASGKTVAADASNVVKISADPSGATRFDAGNATAKAGKVTFAMDNPSATQHNVALKGGGVDVKGEIVGKGGKSEIEATVKPGTYTFYCSVPGHEAGGMKGTLTVK
jgi:plastocyanin